MGSNVRTKMKQAMIKLLERKHFLDITVTDLIQEAGVARASFYRLYSSIDDVADDILNDIEIGAESSLLPILLNGDEKTVKKEIIEVLEKIKNKSIPLVGLLPGNSQMIANKFVHRSIFAHSQEYSSITERYLSVINFGLILSVARTWSYYGFKESASELADFLYDYIYEGKYRNTFYDKK